MLHLAALALLLAMRATPGRAASVECEQAFTGRGGLQPPRSVARTRALRALHAGFWQVRTKDFIMPSGDHNDWQAEAKRPFNVLLVGDSLDRELVVAACYGHPGEYLDRGALYCPDTHRWKNESFMCRSEKFNVANLFVRGILLNGSHQGMCEAGLPPDFAQSLLVAAHRFQAVVGSPPELVLFKSLYWDLRKVFEKGETVEPLVAARRDWQSWMQHELGFVCPYTAEVTRALFDIRAAFPGAVVGLRTDPGWNTAENRFKSKPEYVLSTGTNLMQAVRGVANTFKVTLFDFNHIFRGLFPTQYLHDDIHLQEMYSRMELEMIFHVLHAGGKPVVDDARPHCVACEEAS